MALADERERFLNGGQHPENVRAEIISSWRRCLTLSVPTDVFNPPYRPDLPTEGRLLRAAQPVLNRIIESSGSLGLGFIVTDDEPRILARWADQPSMLRLLDRVNADRGHVFSEEAIGTNGLGTAIELGRTVRVDGAEHFSQVLMGFTCVGVPIRDPLARRLIGVLDITSAADRDNTLIPLLATQAAHEIERALFDQQTSHEQALLRHFLAARRATGGVVVISDRVMLADPRAGRLLSGFTQPLLWERAGKALNSSNPVHEDLPVGDGEYLQTVMTALRDGGEVIGVMMQVGCESPPRQATPIGRTVHRERPPGLVGNSNAFLSAFADCRAAAEGRVALLRGEAGVGKLALARAVHDATGRGTLRVHDAASIEADGAVTWVNELRGMVAGEPGTVVVLHLNLLPRSVSTVVGALLGTSATRGWRCLGTEVRGSHTEDMSPLPGAEIIGVDVPALRDRLDDLPALVTHFAEGRRVAPEVVQLLTRLPWPGNVRELRRVVQRCIANRPMGSITISDLPPDLTAAASRRQLTRFEQAELNSILSALADANGNKTDAARLLGISRATLYRKLRACGIDLENRTF